jgi:hypothetical protein
VVLGRADLQDEQGDGDGEHRVAEEDDPRGVALGAEPSVGSSAIVGRRGRCDRTEPADHQGDACSSARMGSRRNEDDRWEQPREASRRALSCRRWGRGGSPPRIRQTFRSLAGAEGVHARLLEAARRAGATIRAAARTSPTSGQSWLEARLEDGTRWASAGLRGLGDLIAEHAAGFRLLASTLRWVGIALVAVGAALAALSVVAGLFSLGTGGLGTLPAGLIMQSGFLLWGVGDALDTTFDWAEGRIGGQELLVGAGMSIGLSLGGARLVKPAFRCPGAGPQAAPVAPGDGTAVRRGGAAADPAAGRAPWPGDHVVASGHAGSGCRETSCRQCPARAEP